MTNREQPTSRLERLGADAGPPIDPAFANRLETDLRMAMADRAQPAARPWWRPVLIGAASLLVLLAAGAAVLRLTATPSIELVMTAANDTEVILPDGALADGVAGLELPDGTRISVGSAGQAVVDGVVLPSGSVAVVANGRLELLPTTTSTTALDPDESASVPPPSSAPDTTIDAGEDSGGDEGQRSTTTIMPTDTTTEPTTVTDPTTDETNTGDEGDGGPPTSGQTSTTTTPSTTTSDSRRPTTTSATRPPSTSTTATDRTTTEATRPTSTSEVEAELAVTLDVEAVEDTRLRLTWSLSGAGPDVLGYEVQVLAGPRLRTVLLVRDGTATTATVEQLEADVGYRVRAIGAGGEVLATSRVVPAP